jgi:uncharacterized protein (DUF1501 family)
MTDSPTHAHGPGCPDFQTSRRRFLQGAGAVAAGAALSTMGGGVFREIAFAADGTAGNILVVLSLRGGVDGLSLVVPHGDPYYYQARRTIAIKPERLVARGSYFGLHPALQPLTPLWNDGRFGAVQAVGLPRPNRSHFAAMEEMEDADPGSAIRRGWLNRMIGLDGSRNPLEAVQMGGAIVPTSLYGSAPVVAARALKDLSLSGASNPDARARRDRSLRRTWSGARGPLGRAGRAAMQTADRAQRLATSTAAPDNGARYPDGDLGKALADTARLLRADLGVETVTLDYGSWDHHVQLGTPEWGGMTTMAAELAQGLAAFFTDLGTLGNRVTLVTVSEFGRRVQENGSRGLDHGYGNVMLLLGGGVRGGEVHGSWPGLGSGNLVDGDLAVTHDYRSVLAEVLRTRFPHVDVSRVFPGFVPETIGVMR